MIAYHVTDKRNLPSIRRDGLVPSVPEDYGEGDLFGIYLFPSLTDVEDALLNWFGDRIEEWEEETGVDYKPALLEIDITGLRCMDSVGYEIICNEIIEPSRIISIVDL